MKIEMKKLIPCEWIAEENENVVKVWFSAKRGNYNRKPFYFPKEIEVDKTFAEAFGMIIGDGDTHRIEKRHLTYCSKDIDIALFVLNFCRERLLVENKDITFSVQYRDFKPEVNNVAHIFSFDSSRITIRYSESHKFSAYHIQINGAVFRLVFEKILYWFLNSNFLENEDLRRGFLRGVFAAEGCVAVQWKEMYINDIEFCFGLKEENYVALLQKGLDLEGIKYKTSYRRNVIDTIIQNWQNYMKCWEIRLFDRCERKKKTFLLIAKQSHVYAFVPQIDLDILSQNFSQRDLAKIIGSWQGNVCRMLKGKILFSLKQIETLKKHGFALPIEKLRIGCLTELEWNWVSMGLFG